MRKLGQHFLINKKKIQQIVEALELKPKDTIIEIGPGHGELTNELVNKFVSLKVDKFKVIAVEKDKNLAEKLRNSIETKKLGNYIEIIEGDILKILPTLTYKLTNLKTYKLTGNIPYYITGYLLRIIGELKNKPSLIVLTIQKEVAERICAFKKSHMNLLAASVQFWAKPEIVGYVSRKDFKPMPQVDSAIIKLISKNQKPKDKSYYSFIKILFKQPRKTILNNLLESRSKNQEARKEIISKLLKIRINPQKRPQDLNINQIQKLSKLFNYNS